MQTPSLFGQEYVAVPRGKSTELVGTTIKEGLDVKIWIQQETQSNDVKCGKSSKVWVKLGYE